MCSRCCAPGTKSPLFDVALLLNGSVPEQRYEASVIYFGSVFGGSVTANQSIVWSLSSEIKWRWLRLNLKSRGLGYEFQVEKSNSLIPGRKKHGKHEVDNGLIDIFLWHGIITVPNPFDFSSHRVVHTTMSAFSSRLSGYFRFASPPSLLTWNKCRSPSIAIMNCRIPLEAERVIGQRTESFDCTRATLL
ncbi:hypothetical protein BDD12DRAFT_480136 [Trichophaea hybrida]|nr:hypothetical protein BDD12DRAFT_480136 [Trichophaea hybrida]